MFLLILTACSPLIVETPNVINFPSTDTPQSTLTKSPVITPTKTCTSTLSPTLTPSITPTPTPIRIAAVGDIAICGQGGHELTAALLDRDLDAILILGDASNEDGYLWQYEKCFAPAWEPFWDLMIPIPGNHDYYSDPMAGYYTYFGDKAGQPGLGYFDTYLDDWHLIGLNSNCGYVPCGPSSEQVTWLNETLKSSDAACTIAFWHHPRWSSGLSGETYWITSFWESLYAHHADLVLSGHDHHYERIAPLDVSGMIDEEAGIPSFIVGTGGASLRGLNEVKSYSERQIVGQYGVLFLNLYPNSFEWEFINIGGEVLDNGAGKCH